MRLRRRSGQASAEWVGALAVAGALVLALAASAPGWASGLGGAVDRVVCALEGAAGGDGRCAAPEPAAEDDATSAIVEATGPGEPRSGAAGGLRATAFAAGPGGSGALVRMSSDAARAQLGYDDPARCRATSPTGNGSQLCVSGALRDCLPAERERGTVVCSGLVTDATLRDQLSCARAPNAVAADPTSPEQLCRIATDDGSTAVLRCTVDSVAGRTDGSGGAERLWRCADSSQDPFATTSAAGVKCPSGATGPFEDVRDGAKGWRFDFLCLSFGGGAYLCDTFVPGRGDANAFLPAKPAEPQRCTSRTVPTDPAHGDGRDLLGECAGPALAPGAPRGQTLACTLPDGETRVDCAFLDRTVQHCARAADPCTATLATTSANPLVNGGRRLAGPGPGAGGKGGAVGPVGVAALTAHALAGVLQNLQVTGSGGTIPAAASCPAPPADAAGPSSVGTATVATAFAAAAGVAQLVAPDGEPVATFVDGITETDPSGAGDPSAIPGHALDLLSAALGPAVVAQPGPIALIVTQADPDQPLAHDPATNTWTIGANHAGNPRAFEPAADILRLSATQPKVASALASLAVRRWRHATTWGTRIAALVIAGAEGHPRELEAAIAASGFPDAWVARPLLDVVNSLGDGERSARLLQALLVSPPELSIFSGRAGGERLTRLQEELYGYRIHTPDAARRWRVSFEGAKREVRNALAKVLGIPLDRADDALPVVDRAFAPWAQGPPGGIPGHAPNPLFRRPP